MSFDLIKDIDNKQKKLEVVDARSGDTVRVTQKIKEGNKERLQTFEGVVIRTSRKNSSTSSITVRRIASGVGVEKTYLIHNPLVEKIEVIKRGKVRRKYLTFLRDRAGKSARLTGKDFDKSINDVRDEKAEAEAEKLKAQKEAEAAKKAEEKAKEQAELEAKQKEVEAAHAANKD